MERYEQLAIVGEGSYGVVMKCRHKDSDQIVAVKKFLETEDDGAVRKMALREIRMLKKLKHENLVMMIEVFRHRKRFYLVFEYMAATILDELEKSGGGMEEGKVRERVFQVVRALSYCHFNHVVHRDVKPENILISSMGVVKLCDFGFARVMTSAMEPCTEYVATRWYRAPELLVGEQLYGTSVDVWATGCLVAEMLTSDPLFPGESDIDQLYIICKAIGKPCVKHLTIMSKNTQLRGMIRSCAKTEFGGFNKQFTGQPSAACVDFMQCCLRMDPLARSTSEALLSHAFFTHDKFATRFLPTLRARVTAEMNANPLLRKHKSELLLSTDRAKCADDKMTAALRRSSHGETLRWKLDLLESGMKRKFSCDNSDISMTGRKSYREKTGLTFLKSTKPLQPVQESDTSSSLSIKHVDSTGPSDSGDTITTSSYNCSTRAMKKSPTLLQNIPPSMLKNAYNRNYVIPPATVKNSRQQGKKQAPAEKFINIEPLHLAVGTKTPPQYSTKTNNNNHNENNYGNNSRRKGKQKHDFVLPNLPGATSSPKDGRNNKANISPEAANIITPAKRHKRSKKRKYNELD